MSKIFSSREAAIGEKILIARGIVKLGPKPGWFSRTLGWGAARPRTIDGVRVEVNEAYIKFCEETYRDFEAERVGGAGQRGLIRKQLDAVNKRYLEQLRAARTGDRINWKKVFADGLLLGKATLDFAQSFDSAAPRLPQEVEKNEPSDSTQVVHKATYQGYFNAYVQRASFVQETVTTAAQFVAGAVLAGWSRPFMVHFADAKTDTATTLSSEVLATSQAWNAADHPNGELANQEEVCKDLLWGSPKELQPAEHFIVASVTDALAEDQQRQRTTVYCGPMMDCSFLQDAIQSRRVAIFEFDKNKLPSEYLSKLSSKTDRVVLCAHGNSAGEIDWEPQKSAQPDDLVRTHFPNARVIHVFACRVGTDPVKNFASNALRPGQVMLLHAGDKRTLSGTNLAAVQGLLAGNTDRFPPPNPTWVVGKANNGLTIFSELKPMDFEVLRQQLSHLALSADKKLEVIYDMLAKHHHRQFCEALIPFDAYLEEFTQLRRELIDIGWRDLRDLGYEVSPMIKRKSVVAYARELVFYQVLDPNSKNLALTSFYAFLHGGVSLEEWMKPEPLGNTLIHLAAAYGHAGLVKALASMLKPKELTTLNARGWSAVYIAAEYGHVCVIKEFMARIELKELMVRNAKGFSPIHVAAEYGHVDVIKLFIEAGTRRKELMVPGSGGWSPMHLAAKGGYLQVIELLVNQIGRLEDWMTLTADGLSPIDVAIRYKHTHIVDALRALNPEGTLNSERKGHHAEGVGR